MEKITNSLFCFNPLPSWIYDYKTLEILDVNIAALQHYGYSREEFLSFTLKDLRPIEEFFKLVDAHQDIKSRHGNISFGVFTHQKKNGTLIQMEINGHKVDFNSLACILVVCQDVTETLAQKNKIIQSEQRFKALVQDGADMITILDLEGNYKFVNPSSQVVLNIEPNDYIGKNAFQFIHPDDKEKTLAGLQKIKTEKKVVLEPYRFLNYNKEWRWIDTVLTNMIDNPAVNGIVSNSRDITETIYARKQIESNELFNRTVLESSPDCLKVLDADGRLQFINFNGLCQMEIDDFSKYKNKNWWTIWGTQNEEFVKESLSKPMFG